MVYTRKEISFIVNTTRADINGTGVGGNSASLGGTAPFNLNATMMTLNCGIQSTTPGNLNIMFKSSNDTNFVTVLSG